MAKVSRVWGSVLNLPLWLPLCLPLWACSASDSGESGGEWSGAPDSNGGGGGGVDVTIGGTPTADANNDTAAPLPDGGTSVDADNGPELPSGPDGLYCQPNSTACLGPTTLGTCDAEGSAYAPTECEAGQGCQSGACVAQSCTPGQPNGQCASSTEILECSEAGTEFVAVPCPDNKTCFEGECTNFVCVPGSSECQGTKGFKLCLPDGSGFSEPQLCKDGQLCDQDTDKCTDACAANTKDNLYVGCNYYAVDLDNVEGGQNAPVAVVVSVPASDESEKAVITIVDSATGEELTAQALSATDETLQPSLTMEVEPGHLKLFYLPTTGAQGGNPLDGSIKTMASYRISSTAPVSVHQFNPLNGEGVYTNDASLLLPSNLGGKEYIVSSWPHRRVGEGDDLTIFRGFITVVATEPGTTTVDVYARGRIAGGIGVPAIQPNQNHTFSLVAGEVLNLETEGDTGGDLTGTYIRASQKVTVFGGHECANVPVSVSYCDHMEQQLIPLETWGTTYLADAFKSRNSEQFDLWRVVGGADNITVTTDPPIPGFEAFTLHRGSFVELKAKGSFLVQADGPVFVGHYMTGSNYPGYEPVCQTGAVKSGIGDPAFTLAAPIEQYLSSYVVLTPPGYKENYLNIVGKAGITVTLDGAELASSLFEAIGTTGYVIAQVPVNTGVHAIESTGGQVGVTAYGYDCDVSYAYPGGLQLEQLKESDEP